MTALAMSTYIKWEPDVSIIGTVNIFQAPPTAP